MAAGSGSGGGGSGEGAPAPMVGGIFLPAGAIRALCVGLVAAGIGLPWLARGVGVLGSVPVVESVEVVERVEYRPELVRVPGGAFEMGSPAGEVGREEDESQHQAKVASFEICRTEVTVAQWRAVTGEEPRDCGYGCEDEHPIKSVSWEDAVRYLGRLTELENEGLPAEERMTMCYAEQDGGWAWERGCTGFRLPTETEWEYAARADTKTAYSFGSDVSELDEHAWHDGNSGNKVHPVGEKKANPWGLYDMHGNVLEWVWDWYGEYEPRPTAEGHDGPDEGDYRALRGGSFGSEPLFLRSAFRGWYSPTYRSRSVGFRCARSLSAESLDSLTP